MEGDVGVEAGGGLVEEEERRVGQDGAGQVEALAHAAGVATDLHRAVVGQVDAFEGPVDGAAPLAVGQTLQVGEEEQVVAGAGARVEAEVSAQDEPHSRAGPLRVCDGVHAVDGDGPGGGAQEGGAHAHGRALAGAVGA